MPDASSIRDILDFWFLPRDHPDHGKVRDFWFNGTPALDAEIRARFGGLLDRAVGGGLDGWRETAEGALALILLCDQFPRNIHRRSARAFSGDGKAIETARIALARGYPIAFPPAVRAFFYMPFQHSEQLADQELCCALFASLGNPDYDRYAIDHRNIVARFGRFPHRNEVLGRKSTPEEIEYLKTANRFGQ